MIISCLWYIWFPNYTDYKSHTLVLWPGIGMQNLSYLPVPDLEQTLGCHSLSLRILSSPLCDPYSWWLLPSVVSNAFPSLWSKTGVAATVIPYCAECTYDALAKCGTSQTASSPLTGRRLCLPSYLCCTDFTYSGISNVCLAMFCSHTVSLPAVPYIKTLVSFSVLPLRVCSLEMVVTSSAYCCLPDDCSIVYKVIIHLSEM